MRSRERFVTQSEVAQPLVPSNFFQKILLLRLKEKPVHRQALHALLGNVSIEQSYHVNAFPKKINISLFLRLPEAVVWAETKDYSTTSANFDVNLAVGINLL